jgi:uncharacterized protein (TIGR03086 family)
MNAAKSIGATEAFQASLATFDRVVDEVDATDWHRPTPCNEWDVHALVNHVVGEDLWAARLLAGETIAEVGHDLDGDVLGPDPVRTWRDARAAAGSAAQAAGEEQLVDLSMGPTPAGEYLRQLAADHLIHAWDLATAVGAEFSPDDALVDSVSAWYAPMEATYRQYEAVGPRPEVPADADRFTRLLAGFGRSASAQPGRAPTDLT